MLKALAALYYKVLLDLLLVKQQDNFICIILSFYWNAERYDLCLCVLSSICRASH